MKRFLIVLALGLTGCAGVTLPMPPGSQPEATATVQATPATATQTPQNTATPDKDATRWAWETQAWATVTAYAPTATLAPTASPATIAASGCTEQMLGPWQPPADKPFYDYVQVNTEFVDSDYLVSLYWEKGINLTGWQVQKGDGKNTEIVFTVRTSIKEVQFAKPRSGVAWRLCAHPDAQLHQEASDHASRIAAERSWLRVYDVGDLWTSLQGGDKELIALIKCVTPPTQGIPDCHAP